MAAKENDIQIRPMNTTDIDAIFDIDKKISGTDRALTYEDMFKNFMGGEIGCSFVAEVKRKVVGFVLASLSYVPEEVSEVCMIQILGVDPAYRRKGIASRLIGALADSCYSKGLRMMRVMVDQHDRQLQGLFEALEFRRGSMIDYSLTL